MKIKVISVHPSLTRIESNGTTIDIPTDWFPTRPESGQSWELVFTRDRTDTDRIAELNRFIGTA